MSEPSLGPGGLDQELERPSHGRVAARPSGGRRSALAILVCSLALMLAGIGFYAVRCAQALDQITRSAGLLPDHSGRPSASPADEVKATAPVNIVLMGSDTRGNERGRSDALMLAHLDAARRRAYLISFPRDMYVTIPGHGRSRINAAYSFGGAALSVRTLENLLGVRIDHAVMLDFEGFIGLTEDVGGVTVTNDIDSASRGYTYPAGQLTLSGDELLAYVRERYDLPGGDLARAARQRDVVKALALKLLAPQTLGNPITFNAVADRIGGFFTVDDTLTTDAMWKLASSLHLEDGSDIRQLQAPISGYGRSPAGASIDIVDRTKLAKLATALRTDDLEAYWELNGHG